MTRKLMIAAFVFVVAAGIAMNGMFKSEMSVVKASTEAATEAAAASPVFGVCDVVRNVKVRALGRSDFEVTWEFSPSDPCLQAQSFYVEVRAKRNVGGAILGKEVINAAAGERRVIAKFRSIGGIDKVEATVTASITIKPFGQAFLNL